MNAADHYKNQITNGWTRIDMLLALYDAIVDSLSSAEEAQAGDDQSRLSREMLRTQRLMLGILAGIDHDRHDLAGEIGRLCHFALDRISQQDLSAARRILSILKEAFEGISEQAHELERTGVTPPLEEHRSLNVTA
jgi:flagellin-specific chaperone FliS